MNINDLQPVLKTKKDADELRTILYQLNDLIFRDNIDLEKYIYDNLSQNTAVAIIKCLKANSFEINSSVNRQDIILRLIDLLKKIPAVHLILAFDPKKKLIDDIHNWFCENLKGVYVIDITVEKEIVAGSIISFNGKANDYSIERKLEQYIKI